MVAQARKGHQVLNESLQVCERSARGKYYIESKVLKLNFTAHRNIKSIKNHLIFHKSSILDH